MTTRLTVARYVTLAVALVVLAAAPALACPNCKEAVADGSGSGAGDPVARGYYWSILLMMSMPLVLGAGVAGMIYYQYGRGPAVAQTEPGAATDAGAQTGAEATLVSDVGAVGSAPTEADGPV